MEEKGEVKSYLANGKMANYGDPQLVHNITNILNDKKGSKLEPGMDIEWIVDELPRRYTRNKPAKLRKMVSKAIEYMLLKEKTLSGMSNPTQPRKRKRLSASNSDDSDSISRDVSMRLAIEEVSVSQPASQPASPASPASQPASPASQPASPAVTQVVGEVSNNWPVPAVNGGGGGTTPLRNNPLSTTPGKSTKSESETKTHLKKLHKKRRLTKSPEIEAELSSNRFTDIFGCDDLIKELEKLNSCRRDHRRVRPAEGILISGPSGCGKTLLANAIAGELGQPILQVSSAEMVSGISGETEENLRNIFNQAVEQEPSILLLDDVDILAKKDGSKDMACRIVSTLAKCMDDLVKNKSRVLVIGASSRIDTIDESLRRPGRFSKEFVMAIPDRQARHKILSGVLEEYGIPLGNDVNLESLARATPGYVGVDLKELVVEADAQAFLRCFDERKKALGVEKLTQWTEEDTQTISITKLDFDLSLNEVQPSIKRGEYSEVPDVTWDDIGALADVREVLQENIMNRVARPELFQCKSLSTPPGILLHGPPGCGKTMLAKALANESGINFISVAGAEVLDKYVGESERAVRKIFQRARQRTPCVIFFDELDALSGTRTNDEGGARVSIVNTLLTEMDGMKPRGEIYLIAATNRKENIDPAILRSGRLGMHVYVGFPSASDRHEILKAQTKTEKLPLADDVDLKAVAEDSRCEQYTGADMAQLVTHAAQAAATELIKTSSPGSLRVYMRHFNTALSKVKPKEWDFAQKAMKKRIPGADDAE